MSWTTKRRCSCYLTEDRCTCDPAAEPPFMPPASLVWLLRVVAIAIILLLVLIGGPRASAAETRRLDAAWIPIADGSAQPTAAWSEFCDRSPNECAINPVEPSTIQFDERVWNAIVAINKQVDTIVRPQADIHHWGVIDRNGSDQHDFAIGSKLRQLWDNGGVLTRLNFRPAVHMTSRVVSMSMSATLASAGLDFNQASRGQAWVATASDSFSLNTSSGTLVNEH